MVIQVGGTKLERFLPKNQHTQRKSLNFDNWCNGEASKMGHKVIQMLLNWYFSMKKKLRKKVEFWHILTPPQYTNFSSQNSMISFGYVDF